MHRNRAVPSFLYRTITITITYNYNYGSKTNLTPLNLTIIKIFTSQFIISQRHKDTKTYRFLTLNSPIVISKDLALGVPEGSVTVTKAVM